MSTTNTNGQVARKSLASQLDRLDSIIDALANGLNETVADVVRQAVAVAVQQTVETVLREVLTRPELLHQLAGQAPAPPAAVAVEPQQPRPSKLRKAAGWIGGKLSSGWAAICDTTSYLSTQFRKASKKVWEYRRPVLISLLVGVAAGGIGYWGGEVIASMALGLCSSAMTFFGLLAAPFVRLWKSLQAQGA